MKILIPQNIYSAIFAMSLPGEFKNFIEVRPSSVISNELETDDDAVGLMPSMDLYKHKELFVSGQMGLSFDGVLSNAYIYFQPDQVAFKNLMMRGDVSTNEMILSKILFTERYAQDVTLVLDTAPVDFENKNYIIVGNENLDHKPFDRGMSFADQIAALIDYPYVNFVLASKQQGNLIEFGNSVKSLDKRIEDNIENYLSKIELQDELYDGIVSELNSVYFEVTENEREALTEMIKLPFYKGIYEDIIDIKFV